MIVKVRVGASALVADERLSEPGFHEALVARLVGAVISEGDKSAWLIRHGSVRVYPDGHLSKTLQTRFSAVWSPPTGRLHGGEYDGVEITVRRSQSDGLPPERLTLPYRAEPYAGALVAGPVVTGNPSYIRVGTHPIDDVWIYEIA